MNPRAAINDLLPFQGSPFNHLGTSALVDSHPYYRIHYEVCAPGVPTLRVSVHKRREWDSNPRALADKRFSRPPRYDHFDISPKRSLKRAFIFYRILSILSSSFPRFSYFFISTMFHLVFTPFRRITLPGLSVPYPDTVLRTGARKQNVL